MVDAKPDLSRSDDGAVENVEAEIREIVRGKKVQDALPNLGSDILKAGAISIAEIDKLMAELKEARDYLQSEGERVRRIADRYGHLTKTASDSVRAISESIGKWRAPDLALVAPADTQLPQEPEAITEP